MKLPSEYLFSGIGAKLRAYTCHLQCHPDRRTEQIPLSVQLVSYSTDRLFDRLGRMAPCFSFSAY